MDATFPRNLWYADGLRWIGSVFHEAADRLEAGAADAMLDPRTQREIEAYVDNLRARMHLQG